jgi:hypothetical protein
MRSGRFDVEKPPTVSAADSGRVGDGPADHAEREADYDRAAAGQPKREILEEHRPYPQSISRAPVHVTGNGAGVFTAFTSERAVADPANLIWSAMIGMNALACPKVPLPFRVRDCVGV